MKIIIKLYNENIGRHSLEKELIVAFINWQEVNYEVIQNCPEPLVTSKGRSKISIQLPDESIVHSFKEVYEYWNNQGLMLC